MPVKENQGSNRKRQRGGQPTDHAVVTARVAVATSINPGISIRQLSVLCRARRQAIREAMSRLEEADRWVREPPDGRR